MAEMTSFTIPLPPVTKKNSQQIFRGRNGKPFIVPSQKYREYQEQAAAHCPREGIDYPVNVRCLFFMPTRRRVDLTNLLEALDDVLVHAGTVVDDNCLVVASHDGSRVILGDKNPRTEVEIERVRLRRYAKEAGSKERICARQVQAWWMHVAP